MMRAQLAQHGEQSSRTRCAMQGTLNTWGPCSMQRGRAAALGPPHQAVLDGTAHPHAVPKDVLAC